MDRYMIYIPAAGPCKLVACDDGDSIKLETMQELVDGPIEVTPSCLGITWAREPVDGIDLIVNEEGRLRGLNGKGDIFHALSQLFRQLRKRRFCPAELPVMLPGRIDTQTELF